MPKRRRKPSPYVEAKIEGDTVRCSCGGEMSLEEGFDIGGETPGRWIWWRCNTNQHHLTHPLPMPREVTGVR